MKHFFKSERLDVALQSAENTDPEMAGLVKTARELEALSPVPPIEKEDFQTAKAAFLARAAAIAPQEVEPSVSEERTSWLSRLKKAVSYTHLRAHET